MKTEISTDKAPQVPGLLSQGIVSSNFVFVSGQIHSTLDGTLIEGTVEVRLKQVMNNVREILKASGTDSTNVVKVNVYVTDISELPKLNEEYRRYFTEPFPVREAVCVKALPLGASIEISVIAVK